MRNIKLTIEYDGTKFKGWQTQPVAQRTVQLETLNVLKKLCKETVVLFGSGRTDTGVHALCQTANFKTNSLMPCDQLLRAINHHLPEDISISAIEEVPDTFHAQYSIKAKTYRYAILKRQTRSALYRHTALLYPHKINFIKMREAAKDIVGKKDFRGFQALNSTNRTNKNTVRTVKEIKISAKENFIYIDITADGFLYKMVRNIVGALLAIGSGKLEKGSIKKILKEKQMTNLFTSAKAHGLFLYKTFY